MYKIIAAGSFIHNNKLIPYSALSSDGQRLEKILINFIGYKPKRRLRGDYIEFSWAHRNGKFDEQQFQILADLCEEQGFKRPIVTVHYWTAWERLAYIRRRRLTLAFEEY